MAVMVGFGGHDDPYRVTRPQRDLSGEFQDVVCRECDEYSPFSHSRSGCAQHENVSLSESLCAALTDCDYSTDFLRSFRDFSAGICARWATFPCTGLSKLLHCRSLLQLNLFFKLFKAFSNLLTLVNVCLRNFFHVGL